MKSSRSIRAPVNSQRDIVLDLLDAISTSAPITLSVRAADGSARSATLDIPNADERRRLTEPSALINGLGLRFYEPPIPAVLGTVEADGPAARAGLAAGDQILASTASRCMISSNCSRACRRTRARAS